MTVSDEQIAAALSGGTVVLRWRYEWRSLDYVLLGAIAGEPDISSAIRPGGDLKMSTDADLLITGRVQVDTTRLPFDITQGTNWIAVILELLIEGTFVQFPMALVRPDVSNREALDSGEVTADAQLSDAGIVLRSKTVQPYVLAAGSSVTTALRAIFDSLGLRHSIPTLTPVTPVTISFGPATPWRQVVDRLTDVVNYYPCWPDGEGIMTTAERTVPKATPDVVYGDTEPVLAISPFSYRNKRDGFNRAIVQFDHPERTPGFVERINADPSSSISTLNLGETVTNVLRNGGYVLDNTTGAAYATWALRDQHGRANAAELRTVVDPRRQPYDQVLLNLSSIAQTDSWTLIGWNIPLDTSGEMVQALARADAVSITS